MLLVEVFSLEERETQNIVKYDGRKIDASKTE